MEVPIIKLSIHQLQAYALKYFPEEFGNIPSAETIRYETFRTLYYENCQPLRIAIGTYRSEVLHAYISESGGIVYDTSRYRLFPGIDCVDVMRDRRKIKFFKPFERVMRHPMILQKVISTTKCCGWSVIMKYYFGIKGMIEVIESPYLLTMFEEICTNIQESDQKHGSPRLLSIEEMNNREGQAVKRLEALCESEPGTQPKIHSSTDRQDTGDREGNVEEVCQPYTDVNVNITPEPLSQSQTFLPTSEATGLAIQETGTKRKGVGSSDDLNVFKERRNLHLDLLKKSAQGRQTKMERSAHHISLLEDKQKSSETLIAELQNKIIGLESENEDLRAPEITVADIQEQHAHEITVLKEDHTSQLVDLRCGYGESIDTLAHQLEEEKQKTNSLTVDVDHQQRAAEKVGATFRLYKTQAEHRASKAKDLYGIHKAAITLFYEGDDTEEQKDAAIKACEDEFGELDVDLESIEA